MTKGIKKNKPHDLNFIMGYFKPMFEDKLEFKRAYTVTFKGFKVHNSLEMEGTGEVDGIMTMQYKKCQKATLADHKETEAMLVRNIKKYTNDCATSPTNIIKSPEGLISKPLLTGGEEIVYKKGELLWSYCYSTFDFIQRIIKTEVHYSNKLGKQTKEIFESKF